MRGYNSIGDFGVFVHGDTSHMDASLVRLGLSLTGFGVVGQMALRPLNEAFEESVKIAASFEQATTNSAVVTGKFGQAFVEARTHIQEVSKELGERTIFTTLDAASAFETLARKGIDVTRLSAESLKPILDLASSTLNDLNFTTTVVTSAMQTYGFGVESINRISDVFAIATTRSNLTLQKLGDSLPYVGAIAKDTGIRFEELVAALAELANRGIPATIAATGLRRVIGDLLEPSKKLRDFMAANGITMADLDVRARGLAPVLETLRKAELNAGDALEIFGLRGGPTATALVSVGASGKSAGENIAAFTSLLEQSGGAADALAKVQLATLQGAFEELTSKIEVLRINIGMSLVPTLTTLSHAGGSVVSVFNDLTASSPLLTTAFSLILGSVGLLAYGFFNIMTPVGLFMAAWPQLSKLMTTAYTSMGLLSTGLQFMVPLLVLGGKAALALGVAVAAWEFGRKIGEVTGLTAEIQKLVDALFLLGQPSAAEDAAAEARYQALVENFERDKELHRATFAEFASIRLADAEKARADLIARLDTEFMLTSEGRQKIGDLLLDNFETIRRLTVDYNNSSTIQLSKYLQEQASKEFSALVERQVAARRWNEEMAALEEERRTQGQAHLDDLISRGKKALEEEERNLRKSVEQGEAYLSDLQRLQETLANYGEERFRLFQSGLLKLGDVINDFGLDTLGLVDDVEQSNNAILASMLGFTEEAGITFKIFTEQIAGGREKIRVDFFGLTEDEKKFVQDWVAYLEYNNLATEENLNKLIQILIEARQDYEKQQEDWKKQREKEAADQEKLNEQIYRDQERFLRQYVRAYEEYLGQASRFFSSFTQEHAGAWKAINADLLTGTMAHLDIVGNFTQQELNMLDRLMQILYQYGIATEENLEKVAQTWFKWVEKKRGIDAELLEGQSVFNDAMDALLAQGNSKLYERLGQQSDILRHHIGRVTLQNRDWSLALAAVAEFTNATFKTQHDLLLNYLFEYEELMTFWQSITQETRDRLYEYYLDIADGISETTGNIRDILAGMVGASWYTDYMNTLVRVTQQTAQSVASSWKFMSDSIFESTDSIQGHIPRAINYFGSGEQSGLGISGGGGQKEGNVIGSPGENFIKKLVKYTFDSMASGGDYFFMKSSETGKLVSIGTSTHGIQPGDDALMWEKIWTGPNIYNPGLPNYKPLPPMTLPEYGEHGRMIGGASEGPNWAGSFFPGESDPLRRSSSLDSSDTADAVGELVDKQVTGLDLDRTRNTLLREVSSTLQAVKASLSGGLNQSIVSAGVLR